MGEDLRIELPIETERLVIRPLRIEDAADLGETTFEGRRYACFVRRR